MNRLFPPGGAGGEGVDLFCLLFSFIFFLDQSSHLTGDTW